MCSHWSPGPASNQHWVFRSEKPRNVVGDGVEGPNQQQPWLSHHAAASIAQRLVSNLSMLPCCHLGFLGCPPNHRVLRWLTQNQSRWSSKPTMGFCGSPPNPVQIVDVAAAAGPRNQQDEHPDCQPINATDARRHFLSAWQSDYCAASRCTHCVGI